jgi:patatin-related protein
MYGGVSLAIYINGVANELFRAVRGRGTYRLVKALTDSDVIVDVLSGSSAGGINGVLLAYALCNEREFGGSSKLWRRRGDIGGLMRGIDEPLESYQSLLDSEGKYEPWLEEAFDELKSAEIDTTSVREDKSSFEELDLFVTGTDFYGRKSVTFDDRAAGIDVKDHRTVFWLKHRAGRKEPFSPSAGDSDKPGAGADAPTTHAALARLARITSCFPGAFAPITVDAVAPVSRRLRRWGAVKGQGQRVYIDGGVLDNKPFSTTLEAIHSRLAVRPVSRWLLYVEPDPERFEADPEVLKSPAVVQTGVASLTALPGYESIADDLRRLRAHNEQAVRIKSLRDALVGLAESLAIPTSEQALDSAPRSSAERAKHQRDLAERKEYVRFRLVGLADQVFHSLFTREVDGGGQGRTDPQQSVFEAQRALRSWFMDKVVPSGESDWPTYARLDVAFRLRRLFHLTYRYQHALDETGLASAVNRQIETLEIMRSALEAGVERLASEWFDQAGEKATNEFDESWAASAWQRVFDTVNAIANVPGPARYQRLPKATRRKPAEGSAEDVAREAAEEATEKKELKDFAARLRRTTDGPDSAASASATTPISNALFFQQSDDFEKQLFANDELLASAHANYERVDGLLYPIEAVAGLRSYDVVSLARVSPRDAQFGLACKNVSQKVTGTRYGHFAAFFKRSWRSNDILWGRLDGACELIDVLLKSERLHELFGSSEVDAQLLAGLELTIPDIESDPTALPLPQGDRKQLFRWLRLLISRDATERRTALDEFDASKQPGRSSNGPMDWIILGAQLEALRPGLADVFSDHHSESLEHSRPGVGSLGESDVAKQTQESMDSIGNTPEQLIQFFRDKYKVGAEDLSNVPAFVVADWVTRGLILARNSLLVSAGKRAEAIRSQLVFQILFGWPLRALAELSALLRRAPHRLADFTLAALAYIVLSVTVLVLFYQDIKPGIPKTVAQGLFIGCPLLLVFLLWLLARVRGPGRVFSKTIRVVAGLVGVAFSVSLVPVAASVRKIDPKSACSELPESLILTCEQMWTAELTALASWIVLGAAGLGLLSVFGVFGWLGRKLLKLETIALKELEKRQKLQKKSLKERLPDATATASHRASL